MIHIWRFIGVGLLVATAYGCGHSPEHRSLSWTAIDRHARELMATEDVKGMALAIIENGEVSYVTTYGHRNVERDLPLETNTVMYGASFTKTAFAYMVLQLVDEGTFDLDRPLAGYLPKAIPEYDNYRDLAGDERWRQLTARHVLNHSTGFANFRWLEEDRVLRFHFAPGARYGYSGEGFYLLQHVLEEGLGLNVKDEMQRRIFDRFDMPTTSMQWRPDFADNLADGYRIDGSFEPHDERSNVSAAGSMDTTIHDQANLWAAIVRGEGLSADARGSEISLSAGLGLVTYHGDFGPAWFKGGHNDWTGNFVVCREHDRVCVVLMANSVRAELIYPALVNFVFKDPKTPFWWEYAHVD